MPLLFILFYLILTRLESLFFKFSLHAVIGEICLVQPDLSSSGSSVCQRTDQVVSSTIESLQHQSTSEPLFSPIFMALIHTHPFLQFPLLHSKLWGGPLADPATLPGLLLHRVSFPHFVFSCVLCFCSGLLWLSQSLWGKKDVVYIPAPGQAWPGLDVSFSSVSVYKASVEPHRSLWHHSMCLLEEFHRICQQQVVASRWLYKGLRHHCISTVFKNCIAVVPDTRGIF